MIFDWGRSKIKHISSFLFLSFLLAVLFGGCHPAVLETRNFGDSFGDNLAQAIAPHIKPEQRLAVTTFYDGDSGDYSALGNIWRDRTENAVCNQVTVVARRDLMVLIDELEEHQPGFSEKEVFKNSGADYLLAGRYYVTTGKEKDWIELNLRLLEVGTQQIVTSFDWNTELEAGWQQRAARVTGNIFCKSIEVISPGVKNGPALGARLDRNPACYEPGSRAQITVDTEIGSYLYILNVAADNTVTIDYPNRWLPEKPLNDKQFIFPPKALQKLVLELYPMPGEKLSRESFKIISSKEPLDFSFLKVAEDRIFVGAEAAELKKVLKVLQNAKEYSEKSLSYIVGECR